MSPSHLLPPPVEDRTLSHERRIVLHGYQRTDGFWDLEASLQDLKPATVRTLSKVYPGGVPIHLMAVRLTTNAALDVVAAAAGFGRAPFDGLCEGSGDSMARLVGLNLVRDFRSQVARLIPRVERCTHLSELLSHLPTLAVQTVLAASAEQSDADGRRPIKIDGCRAWRADGPMVREHYPQWHERPRGGGEGHS